MWIWFKGGRKRKKEQRKKIVAIKGSGEGPYYLFSCTVKRLGPFTVRRREAGLAKLNAYWEIQLSLMIILSTERGFESSK